MLEGNLPTSQITGNLPTSQITGELPVGQVPTIPNSKLQNSSITLNGSAVALGGSATIGGGGLGEGQSYSAPSRSVNTTYTNSTGKPIFVSVNISASNTTTQSGLRVDGSAIDFKGFEGGGTYSYMFQAVVPNGSTYEFDANSGFVSLLFWRELS